MMDTETSGQLLQRLGTDAQLWAQEFVRLFGARREDIDEGLMIAWFANAIEAGRHAGLAAQLPTTQPMDDIRIREAMQAAKANPGRIVSVDDL